MDEVNVKSDISSKVGKIIGSFNSDEATELFLLYGLEFIWKMVRGCVLVTVFHNFIW